MCEVQNDEVLQNNLQKGLSFQFKYIKSKFLKVPWNYENMFVLSNYFHTKFVCETNMGTWKDIEMNINCIELIFSEPGKMFCSRNKDKEFLN